MVARGDISPTSRGRRINAYLRAWRRILGTTWLGVVRVSRSVHRTLAGMRRRLSAFTFAELTSQRSALSRSLALAALLAGQAVSVLIAPPGTLRKEALVVSVVLLISMSISLAVLVAEAMRDMKSIPLVLSVWFVGALPWALAFAPVLWPLTWTAGAWLAYRSSRRAGLDAAWSGRTIAVAWVAQGAAIIAVWLASTALRVAA